VSIDDPESYRTKIADFGNACWTFEHFTDDVQTRQYRAPEVILGIKYDTSADMWSMACMAFELVTGDLLFEPKKGSSFDKNDDHLAQMIELLGPIPKKIVEKGKESKNYFNRKGELKAIRKLKVWPLEEVLMEKYSWSKTEAEGFSNFLRPMLVFDKDKRASAAQMLKHEFLSDCIQSQDEGSEIEASAIKEENEETTENVVTSEETYTEIQ